MGTTGALLHHADVGELRQRVADAERAVGLLIGRINCHADAALENPDLPQCPPGMLRIYARSDLRDANLHEYAGLLK